MDLRGFPLAALGAIACQVVTLEPAPLHNEPKQPPCNRMHYLHVVT